MVRSPIKGASSPVRTDTHTVELCKPGILVQEGIVLSEISPTLTDAHVVEFCKQGYLILEGAVPDEINRRTYDYLIANPSGQPIELLQEDWFIEQVLLNPQAAGAVRSLLGKTFMLPKGLANHRIECPAPAQGWHRDGGSRYGPELNHLQVFYYPQDTPIELGPTGLVPGSHFYFSLSRCMGHFTSIRSAVNTAAPAGSIFITVYSIWHRRSESTAHGIRNMLKYCYWRTVPPERDWLVAPDFDPATASYSLDGPFLQPPRQQFRDWYDAAEMFFWLSGNSNGLRDLFGYPDWPMGYPPGWQPEELYKPQQRQR